jgi:hypothetical protein
MKKLIVLLFFIISLNRGYSQIYGYGQSSNPLSVDPLLSSGIYYTDSIRSDIIALTTSGSDYCLTFGSHNTFATNDTFIAGDEALLIQMMGSGIGTFQNVNIISINSCGSGTIKLIPAGYMRSMRTYTFGSGNRVQLIKMNNYNNFTMYGGIVTCHNWDGYTGGVLSFVSGLGGSMHIYGGIISVAGKGFSTFDDPTTSYGTSSGGVAGSSGLSTTLPPSLSNYWTSSCSTSNFSNFGTKGSLAGSFGTFSANSGSKTTYGGSNYSSWNLVMGDPGYWQTTYGAGIGAQGGGHGGAGADNNSPCILSTGQVGLPGNNGSPGGLPGKGGRGGGVIVIRFGDLYLYTCDPVFIADGQNGGFGGNGSDGGMGGKGGDGGIGCCIGGSFIPGGGPGGYGDVGAAGVGGDGGDGGKPGYIWLGIRRYHYSGCSISKRFRANGGRGGEGGKGGLGNYNNTPASADVLNNCQTNYCPNSNGCLLECNPDKAMCLLAQNAASASTSGSLTTFKNAGGFDIAKYLGSVNRKLEVYDGCDIYEAKWRNGNEKDPNIMFPHFSDGLATMGYVNFGSTATTGCGVVITYPVKIAFLNNNADTVLTYYHASATSEALILEKETENRCYHDECPGVIGTRASNGRLGISASDGTIDTTSQPSNSANIILSDGLLWKKSLAKEKSFSENSSIQDLSMFPNPATNEIFVKFTSAYSQKLKIKVIDHIGRLILEQEEKKDFGNNTFRIDLSGLPKGIYSIQLISDTYTRYGNFNIK